MSFKKIFIFLIALAAFTVVVNAQEATENVGIDFFHGTFEEAKEKAKEENKFIFIDVFTTWCGPCKKLSKTTFKDAEVGAFHNKRFVNVKIDAEKGEGPEIASKFKVSAYPTMIYLDNNGQLVESIRGFQSAEGLLKKSKELFVNEEKLQEMTAEFEGGKRDADFIAELLELQSLVGKVNPEVESAYLSSLTEEDMLNEKNSQIIFDGAGVINSKFFDLLQENRTAFEELKGKDVVNNKIKQAAVDGVKLAIGEKDKSIVEKAMKAMKTVEVEQQDLWIFNMELEYYKGVEDWKAYSKHASAYLGKNEVENYNLLNSIAWTFYEQIDNKKLLKQAEGWAQESIAINSNYHNNDTYAALLYKQGKIDEAYTAAEKAMTIAKYKRQDYTATKKLMEKINDERF